ncbi:general stress protein [Paenibacillus sp. HB172176]|uniref:general stress protein n=1 Tax=Paenibacillus sp. HB172176 TaxID=2493690 RepID=UPI0014395155|nr:general stress protein [Paenibacillus sp. HB172176]
MAAIDTEVTKVHTVMTVEEVRELVQKFKQDGYPEDRIFVLTHDDKRTKRIADRTDAEEIGVWEEGLGTAIANIFRSHGDELRAKMRSLGIGKSEAEQLEKEMDQDKIVVIGWRGIEYVDDDYDRDVYFHPYSMYNGTMPPYR